MLVECDFDAFQGVLINPNLSCQAAGLLIQKLSLWDLRFVLIIYYSRRHKIFYCVTKDRLVPFISSFPLLNLKFSKIPKTETDFSVYCKTDHMYKFNNRVKGIIYIRRIGLNQIILAVRNNMNRKH